MCYFTTKEDAARPRRDAGIAIGPILFIIAMLGILAAAIVAGSSGFSTGTRGEGDKAKASALIDIAINIKNGFDRIMSTGISFATIDTDVTHTTAADDLFSPLGGGISPPSTTMSLTPGTTVWHFYDVTLPAMGLGTGTSPNKVAFLQVSEGVCDQINAKATSVATPTEDVGDSLDTTAPAAWPATLAAVPIGCFYNSNSGNEGYYFYVVAAIQ